MDRDTFWQLVDDARARSGAGADDRGPADDPLPPTLSHLLAERLTADEVLAFGAVRDELVDEAYGWPLWGAAHLVEGGCGDDGFLDFRDGLVLAGRRAFERVTADPDSLADHPAVVAMAHGGSAWLGYESLSALVADAWSRVTGQGRAAYDAASEAASPRRDPAPGPAGEAWDFDDDAENRRRLPRLAELFG